MAKIYINNTPSKYFDISIEKDIILNSPILKIQFFDIIKKFEFIMDYKAAFSLCSCLYTISNFATNCIFTEYYDTIGGISGIVDIERTDGNSDLLMKFKFNDGNTYPVKLNLATMFKFYDILDTLIIGS